jgi:hypothetical protein
MKTVSKTIYFDISNDITETINDLIRVRDNAIEAGMIEGTGKFVIANSDYNECYFEFKRPETENERVRRERFEAEKAAKVKAKEDDERVRRERFEAEKAAKEAAKEKAKEDKDRAEYERLKAKFEGVK